MLPTSYVPGEQSQTGSIDDLSLKQVQNLQKVREKLGSKCEHPRFTDVFLLRFLRANKWDVDATTEMLNKHFDVREKYGLNKVTTGSNFSLGPPENNLPQTALIQEMYPHAYHGLAKDGSVLYIERPGLLDPAIFDKVSEDQFLEYFIYQYEIMAQTILPAASLSAGKLIEKATAIVDMEGASFSFLALKVIQTVCKVSRENFPGTNGRMVVINAPYVASWAYGFCKPLLDPAMIANIQLIGSHETALRDQRLSELIATEDIPSFLGGKCQCSSGCMHAHKGPWNDPKIKKVIETVPYWEILTRIVAGEHSQLMAECQDAVDIENACTADACSERECDLGNESTSASDAQSDHQDDLCNESINSSPGDTRSEQVSSETEEDSKALQEIPGHISTQVIQIEPLPEKPRRDSMEKVQETAWRRSQAAAWRDWRKEKKRKSQILTSHPLASALHDIPGSRASQLNSAESPLAPPLLLQEVRARSSSERSSDSSSTSSAEVSLSSLTNTVDPQRSPITSCADSLKGSPDSPEDTELFYAACSVWEANFYRTPDDVNPHPTDFYPSPKDVNPPADGAKSVNHPADGAKSVRPLYRGLVWNSKGKILLSILSSLSKFLCCK